MLASLFVNFITASAVTGGGFADDRLYHALLHRRKQQRAAVKRAAFEQAQVTEREALARRAFESVRAAKPELARQIVQPHAVYAEIAPQRYEVDWQQLVNDLYAFPLLTQWQMEIEDEEAIVLIVANDF